MKNGGKNMTNIKTGNKDIDDLYKAVERDIKNRKGSVVVIGGIALVYEGIAKYSYGLMVGVTGKKPKIN